MGGGGAWGRDMARPSSEKQDAVSLGGSGWWEPGGDLIEERVNFA